MSKNPKNGVSLKVEALEDRCAPATLMVRPFIEQDNIHRPYIEQDIVIVREINAAAKPGLTTAQAHTGGVVHWSLADLK